MSEFSDSFVGCMSGKNLPAPVLDSITEVVEFLDKLKDALENSSLSSEATISALLASGVLTPEVAAVFAEAGETAAEITIAIFISACAACLACAAGSSLSGWLASNPPQPWLLDQLATAGVAVA